MKTAILLFIFLLPITDYRLPLFAQNPPLGEAIRQQHKSAATSVLHGGSLPSPAEQGASNKEFFEGHWHGLELILISPELAREYNIPQGTKGLLIDEITLEAAECGFLAGDIVQSVEGYPTPTLKDFLKATMRVRDRKRARIKIFRQGKNLTLTLRAAAYYTDLGYANMDAAPPIRPGAISPHKDRGKPCTACHVIMRSGGQLPTDEGDILPNPPPILPNTTPVHRYRGQCKSCHQIVTPPSVFGSKSQPSWQTGGGVTKKPAGWPRTLVKTQGQPVVAAAEPGPFTGFPQNVIAPTPATMTPWVKPKRFTANGSRSTVHGKQVTGWMGLEIISVNQEIAEQFGLRDVRGVLVNNVNQGSPADGVGIKRGDIITRVGRIQLQDAHHFREIVTPLKLGQEIELSLFREGKKYEIAFFLGAKPSIEKRVGGKTLRLKMILVIFAFFIVYLLIFQEILGHLLAFILGVGIVLYLGARYGFYSLQDALGAINYYILAFIIGMNLISAILREAGLFDYLAKKVTIITEGDRWKILLFFCVSTYIISCFMDNIATILMMVPMTLALSKDLKIDPKPILICLIISSNIGGASTMVGDFPNMLIALSTPLQFHDFIFYMMPVCLICLVAVIIYTKISHKDFFEKSKYRDINRDPLFIRIRQELKTAIKDMAAVNRGLIVLGFVILGLVLSGRIGINPAIIALIGGIILLFISGMDKVTILRIVGIKDVLFFSCLFVMVGAAEASGILFLFADFILKISAGHILVIALLMMWLAGIMCSFMNAGPTAALFIPVVLHLGIKSPHYLFWWALSLGVLAGSSTFLTSASGGPLASTLVGKFWKKHRHDIAPDSPLYNLKKALSFREYAKTGVPVMLIILIISSCYITILFYL